MRCRLLPLSALLLFPCTILAAPTTTTSTRTSQATACSCTSKATSSGRILTSTLSGSAQCTSKGIQPTCGTSSSTTRSLSPSTSSTRSSSRTATSASSTSRQASSSTTSSGSSSSRSTSNSATSSKTSSSGSSLTSATKSSTTSSTQSSSISSSTKASSSSTSTSTSSSATPSPTHNNGPRGLSYNNPNFTLPFSLSGQNSKTSWSYNWYSAPFTVDPPQSPPAYAYNPAISFAPMLWSTASVLTSVWSANVASARSHYGATAVLAFNEPDVCWGGTACMSVSSAVSGWQSYMQPLAGTVRLGAPAVTNSEQSGQGLDWLTSFFTACVNCTIDFVPIHWYGDAGDVAGFQAYVTKAAGLVGGRKLWITEFGTTSGTTAQTYAFLQAAMQWMDSGNGAAIVERYAWFMDAAGNLINSNNTGLSDLGVLYNSG